MPCEEKQRLLALYKAKVSAHSAAVNDLTWIEIEHLSKDYVEAMPDQR
jgi:hypothetical protein